MPSYGLCAFCASLWRAYFEASNEHGRRLYSRSNSMRLVRDVLEKAGPAPETTPTRFVNQFRSLSRRMAPLHATSRRRMSSRRTMCVVWTRAPCCASVKTRVSAARCRHRQRTKHPARAAQLATRIEASKLIAVGADHGGFRMKEELKGLLAQLGHKVQDFGTDSEEAVDYPDFAHAVARAVANGSSDLGIIIDGAGVGSAMTANKVPGVRAAACYSVAVARNSREHNGANVLTLGSKTISSAEMRDIVTAWLATDLTEDRHRKRVAKIDAIQRQYQR